MNLKALVLAIGSLCAAGGVAAQSLPIVAGGASATRGTITNAVIESICGTTGITLYQSGTNVTRITCPSAAVAGFTNLDFSYDNTTGSYLGVGPVSGNGQNVARINIGTGTTCSAGTTQTIAGKSVLVRTGCGTENAGRPSIGNADVEPDLFTGVLAPSGVGPFIPAGVSQVSGQFGIIFGMIASLPLYRALQTEQGLTQDDTEANAPSLTTSQIISLTTNNGGPLNQTWEALFPNTAATNPNDTQPVRFVRRVAGSGTHSSFSSQFLGTNCAGGKSLNPAGDAESSGTFRVIEYGSTGNLIQAVDAAQAYPTVTAAQGSPIAVGLSGTAKPANYYALGYASLENAPGQGSPVTGTNWRHIKIDGLFPSKTNVQNGRYNWMAEQVLILRAGASAAEQSFFDELARRTGSANVIAGFSLPTRNGVVALPGIADSGETNYVAQRTRFRTLGNSCVRPFAVE